MYNRDDDNLWEPESEGEKIFFEKHKILRQKAWEIFDLVLRLKDSLPEGDEDMLDPVVMMQDNIQRASAKLAGAKALYSIYSALMVNAVLVRVNMEEMKVMCFSATEMFSHIEKSYVQVIKDEIENFRILFVDWVKTFDKTLDYPDEWHLFNNPEDFPPDDEDGQDGFEGFDFNEDDDD